MKFSIITVSYNAVSTIESTLLSIYSQTYQDYEHIIVDGGSSDGTVDIIRKYEDRIAYWISEPDKGVYDAMNKAVKQAKGDWLLFLNSDDTFYGEDVLNQLAKEMTSSNTIYYGNVMREPIHELSGGVFDRKRLCMANICHQAILYPKSVFGKYAYDLTYKLYADWNLNIKCMGDPDFHFHFLDITISNYNINGLSSSGDDSRFKNDFDRIIGENFGGRYCAYLMYLRAMKYLYLLYLRIVNPEAIANVQSIY